MQVAELLKGARKRAGLSQAALALRAKTSQPAVARYEAGTATPSLATLERLLAACGTALRLDAPLRRPARSHLGSLLRRAEGRLKAVGRRHGVRNIRVFGSVARGEDVLGSDVDLLVELERGRTLLDLVGFQQDAEDVLGVAVDAAATRFMKARVRARALREARPV